MLAELSFLRRHGDAADSLMHSAAARPSGRRSHLRLVQSLRDSGQPEGQDGAPPANPGDGVPPTHH
ncbi:MAG: hypothetical protein JSS35_14480 [Proteobacteria bacterium]|nr:hypothetical protein [Pseudomonadota bacterium]